MSSTNSTYLVLISLQIRGDTPTWIDKGSCRIL